MEIVKHLEAMALNVTLGEVNPLDAYLELKQIEKALEVTKKAISDNVIVEAQKYGAKTFEFKDAVITLKANPGRWNFKGSDLWVAQESNLKSIEEQMKMAYQMSLKSAQYITEDGVIVPPAQYVHGSEGISISFKKEG